MAIFDLVRSQLERLATATSVSHGLLVVEIPAAALAETVQVLKVGLQFDMLLDVTAH